MTCYTENNQSDLAMELLIENGFNGIAQSISILMNTGMKIERSKYLQAKPYERTDQRQSYANGYKPKTLKTRVGSVALAVPQTRDCEFYPQSLERGMRSAEVSRASKSLENQLQNLRDRPLEQFPYVYMDARYEKVRHNGVVIDCAVLLAIGISPSGHREVLGVSVKISEQEVHWRDFISSLKDRGLHGVKLFISDAHGGLKAARRAIFPTVPWQRCQFHLQQNAQSYVPKRSMKEEVAGRIRAIFNAPDNQEALRLLDIFLADYKDSAPELVAWAEGALPEGIAAMREPRRRRLSVIATFKLSSVC
jgi:transposase-like protein